METALVNNTEKAYLKFWIKLNRKPMAWRLVPQYHFFPNRLVLARRWAHNREGTLIGGGRGRRAWNGRFFSILFFRSLSFGGEGAGWWWGGGGLWGLSQTIILTDWNCGYLFRELWMTTPPMVLSIRSSKANTNNVSNIAGFLLLP